MLSILGFYKVHFALRYRVDAIVKALEELNVPVKLYVFGSAINGKVHLNSDLDVAFKTIEGKSYDVHLAIAEAFHSEEDSPIQSIDIFNVDMLKPCRLLDEILKGVVVYNSLEV